MTNKTDKFTMRVETPVHKLVEYLKMGFVIWGGSHQIQRYDSPPWIGCWVLHGPTEEGGDDYVHFDRAEDCVWEYLKRVGGNVMATIQTRDPHAQCGCKDCRDCREPEDQE